MNQMSCMIEMLRQISEALPPLEEVVHDVPNFDVENHCIVIDHLDLNGENQQEFGIRDEEELKIAEQVSNLVDLAADVTIDVEVELTTDLKLKLILSASVDQPTYFLAMVYETPTEEVDEFISLLFDDEVKDQFNRSSRNIEVKMLEVIIPRNTLWG